MPKKSKKTPKLTKAEKIASIPIENLVTLKGEAGKKQLISYVRTLRTGYNRRVQSFKRRGIFSYAQHSFESSSPEYSAKQLTKLTRNQLIGELARYQKFFQDKTSSIVGIREVNRAQDARIFGATKSGKPLQTMSDEARRKYWALYDEYKNQYKTGIFRYSSESVQQVLASVYMGDEINMDLDDIMNILAETETRLSENKLEEDMERSSPNVFSGRGPFRQE